MSDSGLIDDEGFGVIDHEGFDDLDPDPFVQFGRWWNDATSTPGPRGRGRPGTAPGPFWELVAAAPDHCATAQCSG